MKMSKRNLKRLAMVGSALPFAIFSQASHAAIDTADVLTGISDAQIAILAVIGGLLALSVAIFGIMKVYRFVSGRAGA
jgi:hypothetical protein